MKLIASLKLNGVMRWLKHLGSSALGESPSEILAVYKFLRGKPQNCQLYLIRRHIS